MVNILPILGNIFLTQIGHLLVIWTINVIIINIMSSIGELNGIFQLKKEDNVLSTKIMVYGMIIALYGCVFKGCFRKS